MTLPSLDRRTVLRSGAVAWSVPVIAVAAAAPAFASSGSNLSTSTGTVTAPQKPIRAVLTISNATGSGPTTALTVTIISPNAVSPSQSAPSGWTVAVTGTNTVVFTATSQLAAGAALPPISFIVDRGNNGAGTVTVVISPGGSGIGRTLSFLI